MIRNNEAAATLLIRSTTKLFVRSFLIKLTKEIDRQPSSSEGANAVAIDWYAVQAHELLAQNDWFPIKLRERIVHQPPSSRYTLEVFANDEVFPRTKIIP